MSDTFSSDTSISNGVSPHACPVHKAKEYISLGILLFAMSSDLPLVYVPRKSVEYKSKSSPLCSQKHSSFIVIFLNKLYQNRIYKSNGLAM